LQTSCNILLQTYSFLPHCTSMCVPQCLHFIGSNWQISFGWRTIKRRNGICNWRQISYIWVCPMLNGILYMYICISAVLLTYIIYGGFLKKCIRLRNRPDRWMCCQVCGCVYTTCSLNCVCSPVTMALRQPFPFPAALPYPFTFSKSWPWLFAGF